MKKEMKKFSDANLKGLNIMLLYVIGIPLISSLIPEGVWSITVANIGLIGLAIYTIYQTKQEFSPFFQKLEQLNRYSYIVAITAVIILVFGILLSFLKNESHIGNNLNQETILQSMESTSFIQFIAIAIFIPILEEILFKYYLFKQMKWTNRHIVLGILLMSLLFVILHCFHEIVILNSAVGFDALYYLLFSIATFVIYKKTDNLLFPISIHMLCNIVALIL